MCQRTRSFGRRREQRLDRYHVSEEIGDVADVRLLQHRHGLGDVEAAEIESANERELAPQHLRVGAGPEQLHDATAVLS
jgi:hypothetical protein